jgi:hypothetical protein
MSPTGTDKIETMFVGHHEYRDQDIIVNYATAAEDFIDT